MESERSVQLMTPLTARTYLEAYYELSNPQSAQNLLPLVEELDGWETIPVGTLRDTWPEGLWEEPESVEGGKDRLALSELENLEISIPDSSRTLRDGAMDTVLQTLLDGPDEDTDLVSEAELLADFLPNLKGKLYEQAKTLKPSPHVLDLLCRALKDETDIDLSPFKGLSPEDMSLVVSRLRKHGKINTLCISNRPDLTEHDLQVVLRGVSGLEVLYILEDPLIPMQALSTLFGNCDIYHSDLLRRPIKPQYDRYYRDTSSENSDDVMFAGEVRGGSSISQLVWIGITENQALDKNYHLESGSMDWQSLRQEKELTTFGWSPSYLRYKRYPLDMPLSTFKTLAGLLRLLKWASSSRLYEPESFSRGAAFSFAMASSILAGSDLGIYPVGRGHGYGLGPLPKTIFLDSTHERIRPSDAHEHLEPGQWAIVLVHEAFNAENQKYLDKRQGKRSAGADSESEDDNPLKLSRGGEQSFGGFMALLLGPDDPFKKSNNLGLPFQAIKRLRYALVTPSIEPSSSDRDFIVADIPTYVEYMKGKFGNEWMHRDSQKLMEVWNSQIAAMDVVGFYGEEDIHDILPKVFPSQKAAPSGHKAE